MSSTLPEVLSTFAVEFDRRLAELVQVATDVPDPLREAVRYAVLAPGKRIRPFLAIECCRLVGGEAQSAWSAAAAVECIHSFSLVHDDLPAMDNDDLRRGQPTVHRKYGEATAILAGDALVTLAFELLAREDAAAARQVALVGELAAAAGWQGMIGGQAADLAGQHQEFSAAKANFIYERKTGRLFEAACRMGAICGGADREEQSALVHFGRHLGRAFQIADDLLDLSAEAGRLGKAVRKDEAAGKQTMPRSVGVEASRATANEEVSAALGCLDRFGAAGKILRQLARFVVERNF